MKRYIFFSRKLRTFINIELLLAVKQFSPSLKRLVIIPTIFSTTQNLVKNVEWS